MGGRTRQDVARDHVPDFGNRELQTSPAEDDIAVKYVGTGWDLRTKAANMGVFHPGIGSLVAA